ncbi:MAG: hypothetical protein ABJC33_01055 [Betaproteobacteria bacterium]
MATLRKENRVLRDALSGLAARCKGGSTRDVFALALRALLRLGAAGRGPSAASAGDATLDDPATRVAGRRVPADGRFGVAVGLVKW